jgi:hypothetical protein
MFDNGKDACCGGTGPEDRGDRCGCGCGSCGGDEEFGESTITMTDTETGEEYSFNVADDFIFEDEHYCVLVTLDENDPEMIIAKVVPMEDGTEGLMSLDDAEYDRVYAEYERICEEETDEDEDGAEEE